MRLFASRALFVVVGALTVVVALVLTVGSTAVGVAGRGPEPAGPVPAAVPAAGFSLTENGVSPAAIGLRWAESTEADFTNYTVYYSTHGSSGPWTFAWSTGTESTTTDVVSDLAPGVTYWWNVTANYETGGLLGLGAQPAQAYSTVLEATQPTVAYLTTPLIGSSSVELNWTNNATYLSGGGIGFGFYHVEEVDDGATSLAQNITVETDNSTTVAGLSPGTSSYSFYVVTYDACSGCAHGYSATQSNVVLAGTSASLVASATASLSTVDTRLPDGFSCTPAGGTPPYTFAWNFTNGTTFTAGGGTTSWSYSAAASYTVTCQATDHAGSYTVTTPITVVVNPAPSVAATASPLNVTAGASVAFRCTGVPGTNPLSVVWTLGDGATLSNPSGGPYANGSASFSSAGTYVVQCAATDALGVRAAEAFVVHVSPRPAYAWVTPPVVLASSVGAGAMLALAVGTYRRREDDASRSSAMSRWLPPTGPAATVHGAKVCPKCGASNVPLRRTCHACGTPLPRNPSP
jgi:hypothetical protein